MKIVTQKADVWGYCPLDFNEALKWIERAGRLCWKSEDKITEGSAEPFVERIAKAGHLSVIEHSNIIFKPRAYYYKIGFDVNSLYLKTLTADKRYIYIKEYQDKLWLYGNIRAFIGDKIKKGKSLRQAIKNLIDDLALYFSILPVTSIEDVPPFARAITVKFKTNRGVTHELVRHRLCVFSQTSTRYVNYGGKEMEFIWPVWGPKGHCDTRLDIWEDSCRTAERDYNHLLSEGWRPEQAREILPNSLATEIVVTAYPDEWKHIFKLRCSKAAHPQMRALMQDCQTQFQEKFPDIFEK